MPRGRPRKKQRRSVLQSAELIGWALDGLEREIAATRDRPSTLTSRAANLLPRTGRRASAAVGTSAPAGENEVTDASRRRRRMSPEARKRISEMMKKRSAERRKA